MIRRRGAKFTLRGDAIRENVNIVFASFQPILCFAARHGSRELGDEPFALSALFTSSLKVSVCASGGLVWARLVFIKRQQWMTSRNSSTLAFCQCMPSPSIGRITERSRATRRSLRGDPQDRADRKDGARTLRLITVPFMDDFASLNFKDLPSLSCRTTADFELRQNLFRWRGSARRGAAKNYGLGQPGFR